MTGGINNTGAQGGNDQERMQNKNTPFSDKGSMIIPPKKKDDDKKTLPIDFMNESLKKIESKISELEYKIKQSKDIMDSQTRIIKDEVIEVKKEAAQNYD